MIKREIILDTETTGLNPISGDRIVEIGALEMVNQVLTGKEFHTYLNPERDMPEAAYKVHGLSSKFLEDKPLFSEITDDFLNFIDGGKLVIHNAPFDVKFLNHELSMVNKPLINLSDVVDTLVIARKKFPGLRVSLDALCKRFKIDNSSRTSHGAIIDSELLAEVYVELLGGRQSKFLMTEESNKDKKIIQNQMSSEGNKLVIKPTKEEKSKHIEFIKNFIMQS